MSGCGSAAFDGEFLLRANTLFRLPEGLLRDLLGWARTFSADEAALRLAERFHLLFFHSDHTPEDCQAIWRREAAPGERQGAMAALLVVSGLNHLLETARKRGIPHRVLLDSLKDLRIWMEEYESKTGRVGLQEVYWLLHTMRGGLFRLGRLQFMPQPLRENIAVAVRRADGLPVLFFHSPVRLREDGQVNGSNGDFAENPFVSSFAEEEGIITGTPVHPAGFALKGAVRLGSSAWEIAALPGCDSLDVHIPKDGKLDFGQCRETMLEAASFFRSHFPEKSFRLFTLSTWLMDPQLALILPPDSNIVRFQREFYLVPILSDERFTYAKVFGSENADVAQAPEDTALRRAVKRYALSGGKMRSGAGILLPEHLSRFGEALYQTQCADLVTRNEAENGLT